MKKLKWGLLTCLTVTSSVVPVLATTSCGKKTPEVNKIGAEYDKEYGVDQAVYTKLKTEFWNKRETYLRNVEKVTDQALIDIQHKDFNNTFKQYDEQLASMKLSYTAVTNAMIDFASQMYNLKLTRQTATKTATWDDLTSAFEGMKQSMNQYMINSNIPETQRKTVLEQADLNFYGDDAANVEDNPGLLPRLKSQYSDPLSGLVKGKAELLSCFSEMNYDVGLLAASNRLKNFMEDYEIIYDSKSENQPNNKLDVLDQQPWFTVGADLSETTSNGKSKILQIYQIIRKSDQTPLDTFDSDAVCPGYTIKPFLRGINRNARTNTYSLDIDWTCVKTAYLRSNNPDPEKIEKTTAHYIKPNERNIQTTGITNAYDTLKKCTEESTLEYPISLSKKGEAEAIKNTYFNTSPDNKDGYISFGWDADPQGDKVNSFDALFSGTPLKESTSNNVGGYEYLITSDSLAKSGLTISFHQPNHPESNTEPVRLDDLISVSGTKSKNSVEMLQNQDELVKDFLDNCSAWADTKTNETSTTNDNQYEATSWVYVDYQNSSYKNTETEDNKYISYCALGDKDGQGVTVDNYTLSNDSYDYLIGEYNTDRDLVVDYQKNKYRSEYESSKTMSIIEGSFLSLTILGCALTMAKCAAPAFIAKIPVYIVIIVFAMTGMIGQITMMSINVDKKTRPLERFVDKLDKIKDSREIKDLDHELKETAEENYLPRYDKDTHIIKEGDYNTGYEKYKNADFFDKVLPTINYYQNIESESSFQSFYETIDQNDVDPKTYLEEMEVWDSKGSCTIAYWTLFAATLTLDITVAVMLKVNPELSDWTAMKVAEAEARRAGKGTESVIDAYKKIAEVRKQLKALQQASKAAKAGGLCTEAKKSLTPLQARQAIELAGMSCNGSEKLTEKALECAGNCFKRASEFAEKAKIMQGLGDSATIAKRAEGLAYVGELGVTTFLKTATGVGKGAQAAGDAMMFEHVLNELYIATKIANGAKGLDTAAGLCTEIGNMISKLTPTAKTAIEQVFHTAQIANKAKDYKSVLTMLAQFDTILATSGNFVQKSSDALLDLQKMIGIGTRMGQRVLDAVYDVVCYSRFIII